MTDRDREILLARIDTLRYSINDPLIDSILSIMKDLAVSLKPEDDEEMGFKKGS